MPTIAITRTTGWLNIVRDGFSGANNPKITYIAIGSGTSTPSSGDTQLANETFRKAVTTYSAGGDGELLVSMFLGPSDLVGGDIEEVGIFAGSSATNTPNSGILIGRGLWNHSSKSGSESITLTLDATVS